MLRPLLKRDDARRMAKTMLNRADNTDFRAISTRRMLRLPANAVSSFATLPSWMRQVRLTRVTDSCVTFRIGGAF